MFVNQIQLHRFKSFDETEAEDVSEHIPQLSL